MSTAPQRERVASVAFTITGEALTRIVRDMWLSKLPRNAITTLTKGLSGITQDQAIDILTGKAKLTGSSADNDINMVKDNATHWENIARLYSVEELVRTIEHDLTTAEVKYRLGTDRHYSNLALGFGDLVHDVDFRAGDYIRKHMLELIDHLLILYPLVGKTSKDLPLFDMKAPWRIRMRDNVIDPDDFETAQWNYKQKHEKVVEEAVHQHTEARKANDPPSVNITKMNAQADKIVGSVDNLLDLDLSLDINALNVTTVEEISKDARMPEMQSVDDYVKRTLDFDKTVEKDESPKPEDIAKSIYNSGYIDPQGQFYGCPDTEHSWFASIMQDHDVFESKEVDAQQALDNLGWVRLTMGRFLSIGNTLTQSQLDTIFDYAAVHGEKEIKFNGNMVKLSELDVRN